LTIARYYLLLHSNDEEGNGRTDDLALTFVTRRHALGQLLRLLRCRFHRRRRRRRHGHDRRRVVAAAAAVVHAGEGAHAGARRFSTRQARRLERHRHLVLQEDRSRINDTVKKKGAAASKHLRSYGAYKQAVRGGWGEESLLLAAAAAEGELVVGGRRRRQQEAAEVDGEQVGAVAAAHGDRLKQAAARHAHLQAVRGRLKVSFLVAEAAGTMHESDMYREDGVAALAVHVAELLLLRRLLRREVLVQGERLRHRHRRHHRAKLLCCFHGAVETSPLPSRWVR
jgi:hypothetical protein